MRTSELDARDARESTSERHRTSSYRPTLSPYLGQQVPAAARWRGRPQAFPATRARVRQSGPMREGGLPQCRSPSDGSPARQWRTKERHVETAVRGKSAPARALEKPPLRCDLQWGGMGGGCASYSAQLGARFPSSLSTPRGNSDLNEDAESHHSRLPEAARQLTPIGCGVVPSKRQ